MGLCGQRRSASRHQPASRASSSTSAATRAASCLSRPMTAAIFATELAVVSMLPTSMPPRMRLTPSSLSRSPRRMSAPIMSAPSSPDARRFPISSSNQARMSAEARKARSGLVKRSALAHELRTSIHAEDEGAIQRVEPGLVDRRNAEIQVASQDLADIGVTGDDHSAAEANRSHETGEEGAEPRREGGEALLGKQAALAQRSDDIGSDATVPNRVCHSAPRSDQQAEQLKNEQS